MRTLKYKVQGQNIIRDSGCDFSHIIKRFEQLYKTCV